MAIACTAALAQIRGALPEDEGAELSVPVRFWWWQPNVAQEMARMYAAPRWEDLTANYSQRTLESLEPLMSLKAVPPRGGRLLLWARCAGHREADGGPIAREAVAIYQTSPRPSTAPGGSPTTSSTPAECLTWSAGAHPGVGP